MTGTPRRRRSHCRRENLIVRSLQERPRTKFCRHRDACHSSRLRFSTTVVSHKPATSSHSGRILRRERLSSPSPNLHFASGPLESVGQSYSVVLETTWVCLFRNKRTPRTVRISTEEHP